MSQIKVIVAYLTQSQIFINKIVQLKASTKRNFDSEMSVGGEILE